MHTKCDIYVFITGTYRFPDTPGYEDDNQLLGASMSIIDDNIIVSRNILKKKVKMYFYLIEDNIVIPQDDIIIRQEGIVI